jgi:hypothetical protein
MRVESTVRASIDLDGTIVGAAARSGIRPPVPGVDSRETLGARSQLAEVLQPLRGPRLAREVAGFDHMPVIAPGSPGAASVPSARDISLQTIRTRVS